MKRHLKIVLFLALCVGLPNTAFSQDVSKTKVKKNVDKKTEEAAKKRAAERAKRLDKDKRDKEAAKVDGPSVTAKDVEAESDKRSPEEIDKLKRALEDKNRSMIAGLEKMIAKDPYAKNMPDLMFQKAELMWQSKNWEYIRERAKYNQCVDAASGGTTDAKDCKEPVADYSQPQQIYKAIAGQYPGYERLDEVFYRLGKGLIEAGKGASAVNYLQKLVKNYPNSRYIPDTHLELGEFFFKKQMLGAAKDNYAKVLKFKGHNLFDYSLYKLGWVYYHQGEFRKSVKTFKAVVSRTNKTLGFQNQAINDLVIAYAEINGGWQEARDYLQKKKGDEFMFKKIGQLAGLYEAQGKDELAVQIFEFFVKEKPNDKRIPQWAESIIIAKKKDVNDLDALEKSMNRFVAYLDPAGTWWAKNKSDGGATSNATLLVDASLSYLSNFYHRRAQKNGAKPDYVKAAGYYRDYIKRFPDSAAAFDMNFFLGEILLIDLGQFEKAAVQYQTVVDLYKNNKVPKDAQKAEVDAIVKDSAYAIVQAFDELVKKNHPTSILVEMSKYDESQRAKKATNQKAESIETKPIPRTDLLKFEKKFVEASDQYSEMYPKENVTPTVDFVAAEVYKSHGQYDKCVPRYESIIKNAPKHRYASFAGNSLLEANYRLKKWDEVETWGRYLLDKKIFDVTPKSKLESAIVFAINEDAKLLKKDGKTDKAVDRWIKLADEFPKSQYAAGSLFNAAAAREAADEITKAVELYERVVTAYPKDANAPQSIFVMGAIFESRADFEKAASYFERMGSTSPYKNKKGEDVKYKDHPKAADALYNAAVIREAMADYDKSIATYSKYMTLYPERKNIRELGIHLAYLEKEKKDWKKAIKRFDAFAKRKDITPVELVEINLERGLLDEKAKSKKWEATSDKFYTAALTKYAELSDDDKKKAKFWAGQARFLQAERIYREFVAAKLVAFPMNKLTKSLQTKGELEQKAEKMYLEVVGMKSPRWVAASAYRVGQMYKDFSDNIYNLPLPKGLTEDQQDAFQGALDDNAFPLQEKALKSFRTALKLALQFKAYNEWSSKSAAAISKLESDAYPITGQDGVEVGHSRTNFSIPEAVTNLEEVIKRVKARKAAQPKVEPAKKAAPKPQASK